MSRDKLDVSNSNLSLSLTPIGDKRLIEKKFAHVETKIIYHVFNLSLLNRGKSGV